jgi:hypothetical protein
MSLFEVEELEDHHADLSAAFLASHALDDNPMVRRDRRAMLRDLDEIEAELQEAGA